uniref:EF-hand domain-containing protein n=1 Tax=Oryctolagus cuniculus TaxID=9986 RepID=A0A5F9DVE7_RABIT
MAEALGVSVTDYTFEDCQLALAEGQLRLPADTCLLEFARLVRGLGLKPERLERDLDKYWERAETRLRGKVSLAQFAECLEVAVSPVLEDLFALFDEGGAGEVDLREFVVALSVVCRPSRTLDTIQLAFKASAAPRDTHVCATLWGRRPLHSDPRAARAAEPVPLGGPVSRDPDAKDPAPRPGPAPPSSTVTAWDLGSGRRPPGLGCCLHKQRHRARPPAGQVWGHRSRAALGRWPCPRHHLAGCVGSSQAGGHV